MCRIGPPRLQRRIGRARRLPDEPLHFTWSINRSLNHPLIVVYTVCYIFIFWVEDLLLGAPSAIISTA